MRLLAATCHTQQAQLLQRNSASAAHVYLGWLIDVAVKIQKLKENVKQSPHFTHGPTFRTLPMLKR